METFIKLLQKYLIKENIDTLIKGFTETEVVKQFANAYLVLWFVCFNGLKGLIHSRSLKVSAWIRASEISIIIRILIMMDIACRKMSGNGYLTMWMCRRT